MSTELMTIDGRTEQEWIADILSQYQAQAGAWHLAVEAASNGMIASVEMIATRKCGRVERFSVSRWPAGWRILRHDLDVPHSVLGAAKKLALKVWPDEN